MSSEDLRRISTTPIPVPSYPGTLQSPPQPSVPTAQPPPASSTDAVADPTTGDPVTGAGVATYDQSDAVPAPTASVLAVPVAADGVSAAPTVVAVGVAPADVEMTGSGLPGAGDAGLDGYGGGGGSWNPSTAAVHNTAQPINGAPLPSTGLTGALAGATMASSPSNGVGTTADAPTAARSGSMPHPTDTTMTGTGMGMGTTAAMALPTEAPPHGAPARQYLNTKVTGHLLDGMKQLAKNQPDKPLKILGEFLLQRSKEVEGS